MQWCWGSCCLWTGQRMLGSQVLQQTHVLRNHLGRMPVIHITTPTLCYRYSQCHRTIDFFTFENVQISSCPVFNWHFADKTPGSPQLFSVTSQWLFPLPKLIAVNPIIFVHSAYILRRSDLSLTHFTSRHVYAGHQSPSMATSHTQNIHYTYI